MTADDTVEAAKVSSAGVISADQAVVAAVAVVPADTRSNKIRRWNKIKKVSIENFKAIKGAAIPLSDVTILVGPNGSGKSSVPQAIHWAARAASYIAPKNTKEMMSFDRLDYLPSSDPLRTAHKGELRSDTKTDPTKITFLHEASSDTEPSQAVTVVIWAARNRGGISAHIEGGLAVTPYKQRADFLTAYIPGLAGLSERETILAQPLLRRQAASGDAGSVLRNVLFNLRAKALTEKSSEDGEKRLARLNELVGAVHPNISIKVNFDDREDYNISATYSDSGLDGESRSLETAATGLLQVIQIFAYLILFRPRLMLIDEPEAHLHPDKQERLIETLERAANEFETQIILTTHSPHIVRAATPNAKIVWMMSGDVKTDDDDAIRRLLGRGGLDKDVLFFIQDEEDKPVRAILRQWPEYAGRLSVCRCFGVDNLPRDKLLEGLLIDGKLKVRAIVHRDRDFMIDKETEMWSGLYKTEGSFVWITRHSDVEAYFCQPEYLAKLFGVDLDVAKIWVNEATASIAKAQDRFRKKRQVINRILWPEGGSPNSDQLWEEGGGAVPNNQVGKSLFSALKAVVKKHAHNDKLLNNYVIPNGFELAPELKKLIIEAIKKPEATPAVQVAMKV